ncbi:MAG: hypothetical protein UU34_C0004G0034 [Candidatus Curtissbacteria bacterium GW2011_GWA1_41_11]|uniref:Uncharacterized protein n=1 Tax=Candidatus Curtissbacteria bacterium GW2011_GWA1_41_11 TaxID=1618409 RepID=A0A0G0UF09_9BACT|nr:MAG: hypothetical protein UU34_C0004G0034 [Candidatus Curtissbacteria bacterium GW2011_GWA1_41_11]
MTATSHALIGASLASIITNPIIGIPVAITSHFAADLVPHWDAGTNHRQKSALRLKVEATLDVLLGFALVLILFRTQTLANPVYMFSMVIAAQLPDWLEAPSWMFNFKVPPFSWMDWIGHKLQSRMQLPWGLVTQVVVVGSLVLATVNIDSVGNSLASLFRLS